MTAIWLVSEPRILVQPLKYGPVHVPKDTTRISSALLAFWLGRGKKAMLIAKINFDQIPVSSVKRIPNLTDLREEEKGKKTVPAETVQAKAVGNVNCRRPVHPRKVRV